MPKNSRRTHGAESRVTTDHEEIKKWAESRGGKPASVKRTHEKDEPGIIRIDFPGFTGGKSLEPISWEEFFEQFDERKLAFLYQEKTASGEVSRFNKLISRGSAVERGKKAA
jgi:hypothetical protein